MAEVVITDKVAVTNNNISLREQCVICFYLSLLGDANAHRAGKVPVFVVVDIKRHTFGF